MIQPVAQLRDVLGDSVYIHTDAAQAVEKIPVNVRALDVDALTIAGHKLYAPKGIGALYMKNPEQLRPIMQGGGQEFGRRAGTENTPYIVALGAAAQLAYETLDAETVRLTRLRDQLLHQLKTEYPAVLQNGTTTGCLPNTLSVRFLAVAGRHYWPYVPKSQPLPDQPVTATTQRHLCFYRWASPMTKH